MADEPPWRVRWSAQLLRQLSRRPYGPMRGDIDRVVDRLTIDPYHAARAERLKHPFTGLRSARIGRRIRLLYRLCEECRTFGDQSRRPIDCCETGATPARTLNLLYLTDHYAGVPDDFSFP